MIKKMNNLSDKIVEYKREVMNSLLTFDIMQAHLRPAHIQNCIFEDFEYIYRQALTIIEVRWLLFSKVVIIIGLSEEAEIRIHFERIGRRHKIHRI